MPRSFDGTIYWLLSLETGREFPVLVFRADADFATSGMVSLTSIDSAAVVAARMTSDELGSLNETGTTVAIERRINAGLSRDDLRVTRFKRREALLTAPDGATFQEFRRIYVPPKLFYFCIFSTEGDAEVVRKESMDSFLAAEGELIDLISHA